MRAFIFCLLAVVAIATEVKKDEKNHSRRGAALDDSASNLEIVPSNELYSSDSYSGSYSPDAGLSGGYTSGSGSGYSAGLNTPYTSGLSSSVVSSGYSTGSNTPYTSGLSGGYNAGFNTPYTSGPSSSVLNNGLSSGLSGSGSSSGIVGASQIVSNDEPIPGTVISRLVQVAVAVPQPVEVTRNVPVRVPQLVPVEIKRPVAVPVAQPYPVHVNKPYPVHVDRPVPVLVPQTVRVTRFPVAVPVPRAYVVALQSTPALQVSGIASYGSAPSVNYASQSAGLGAYSGYYGIQSGLGYSSGSYGDQSALGYPSGSYAGQSSLGYSSGSLGYSDSDSYTSYQKYPASGTFAGSLGAATYPGLQAYSSSSSDSSEGYSYGAPAKKW